jgi:hypothetical protein
MVDTNEEVNKMPAVASYCNFNKYIFYLSKFEHRIEGATTQAQKTEK